jgi:hypothetical protein
MAFPDALAGGALAAQVDGPLLLVPGQGRLTDQLDQFIRANRHRFDRAIVLGGSGAVKGAVVEEIKAALNGQPRPAPPPPPTPSIQLRTDGLGAVPFGTSFEHARPILVSALGEPMRDSGWVDMGDIQICPHRQGRVLEWDGMSMLFGQDPLEDVPPGLLQWFVYDGAVGRRLATVPGIRVGDTNAAVRAAYPDVQYGDFPDYWYWNTDYREPDRRPLHGYFEGTTPDPSDRSVVDSMVALICGETV